MRVVHEPNFDSEDQRRIVVTGVGVVSACGKTPSSFWKTLTQPSGDSRNSTENSCVLPGIADFRGSIDDFGDVPAASRKLIQKSLKLMNRETQLGVAVGQQALLESGILQIYDPERIGVCFGAENISVMPEDFAAGVQACSNSEGQFDVDRWGADGIGEVAPLWLLKCLPNMPACHLAILNDLRGPSNTITQRDVAFNMAIAEACRTIKDDCADAMVVGATGTTLTTFNLMHARLDEEIADGIDDKVCRPFDRRRQGSTPGEGAGAVVLEELNSAIQRGARIYGEILGAASASNVGHDGVMACKKSLASAIRQALRRANLDPESVGHIHAHGLGTIKSDRAEAQAIAQVFGETASRIPVVAAKSHFANAGAGAGALELIASLLALENGCLFPVLNYSEPDPECPVHPVIAYNEAAGSSFLNLNLVSRGLASCVAVGLLRA